MFGWTHVFNNKTLDSWDVPSVTNMTSMFIDTDAFDQPLGSWDVSSVTTMRRMFVSAVFNQPLANWDVSSVTDMSGIFTSADNFNQPLDWDVSRLQQWSRCSGLLISSTNLSSHGTSQGD